MEIDTTPWFALDQHAPARDGWYEVQLANGNTAFANFHDGTWTEKPLLVFTHWRGLRSDPTKAKAATPPSIDAEATAAQGVRAAWNAFLSGPTEDPASKAPSHPDMPTDTSQQRQHRLSNGHG